MLHKQTILFHAIVEIYSSISLFSYRVRQEFVINRLPPLNALRSFEAAARRGSFQAAASELFVTPSAISHQIKTLEEFLGLELFIRQPRRITLTHAGDDYYRSVQRALLEIDRSTQKLISSHQSGELHLSVAPAFLTRWLLPRISSFYEAHPDIMIEISAATGLIDFDHQETDMAVYFGGGDWPGIEMHLLRHYQQWPVFNPKLLRGKTVDKPEDILKYTLLHVNKRHEEWGNWFKKMDTHYKESKQGMYFSSGSLTTAAAINGLGFALADVGFVSEEIASGALVVPFEGCLETGKSFYLVYQKNRALTYSMKAFQSWLMEEMEKDLSTLKE
ncbi:MAG: transcriptional regulator GcvA [Cellvibrionaceae bacterium]